MTLDTLIFWAVASTNPGTAYGRALSRRVQSHPPYSVALETLLERGLLRFAHLPLQPPQLILDERGRQFALANQHLRIEVVL